MFSAVLYFIVATLMLVTVWGAYKGHYDKEFQLTMSQRTLMLQTISYFVYLLAGAAIFAHIEGWPYLDAVYWADFTLLTVGIGDFSPSTHLGRSLLFPFAIGGIIILGLVIGSIRSLVLERGKLKMGARMIEKERQRLLKKMEKKRRWEILEPVTEESGPTSISRSSTLTIQPPKMTERQRRQKEFQMMRKIQEDAHTKRRWTSLIISGFVWFILWFAGAAVFEQTEVPQGWSYFYSLYFAYTSLLTIGYGDLYPVSASGRAFFVFWSLLAVPSLTILISNMGDTIVKGIRDLTLWVGEFTVLPGEQGVKATIKKSASKVSGGRLFDEYAQEVHESPPGILGESGGKRRNSNDSDTGDNKNGRNDPESAAQRVDSDAAGVEAKQAQERGEKDELPRSKRGYHVLLIEEIGKVMRHMHSSPPRKYTFEEWAWYLKLVGEDESTADGHVKARRKVNPKEVEDQANGVEESDGVVEWSWVGVRSPLMGGKGESEWVLERLTKTLQRELEAMRREEEEGSSEEVESMPQVVPEVVFEEK
jgi:potassium channel subfamily K